VYLGNGASELIVMALNGLLDNGDEILVPAPDYPLWTAAVSLSGGNPVHYLCDEQSDWMPDLDDIRRKITPRTKGIVVINPNNPTGALYPTEILEGIVELARQHGRFVDRNRTLGLLRKDIVRAADPQHFGGDVLAAERIQRRAPDLPEDTQVACLRIASAQRLERRAQPRCFRRRDSLGTQELPQALEIGRHVIEAMLLERQARQMQSFDERALGSRLTVGPDQHEIRLQGEQSLGIQMLRIAHPRDPSCRRRIVAGIERADDTLAGTGGVDQFGQMRRQRHNAHRRRGPRRGHE
jgi:hypothetical protein